MTASLGVILYNMALSTTGSQQSSLVYETNYQEDISRERLSVLSVTLTTDNAMNVTLYNYGKIDVIITDAYIKLNDGSIIHKNIPVSDGTITTNELKYFRIPDYSPVPGEYQIKLVSQRGGQYEITWKN